MFTVFGWLVDLAGLGWVVDGGGVVVGWLEDWRVGGMAGCIPEPGGAPPSESVGVFGGGILGFVLGEC